MHIPSLLLGDYAEVRKRCRQAIRRYLRGQQPVWDALTVDGMSDTATRPHLISVEGPHYQGRDDTLYRCDMPLSLFVIDTAIDRTLRVGEDVFTRGLESPWSVLCMFSGNEMNILFNQPEPVRSERLRQYVRAVVRHWEVLDAEGARYAGSFGAKARLWDVAGTLKYALANLGVPPEALMQPLPPVGGPYALLAQADPAKASDLVALGKAHQASWRSAVVDTGPEEESPPSAVPAGAFASAAMSAALAANDPDAVRRLIEAGEDANAPDDDTLQTPLGWAVERGDTELVGFLLDHGADIEEWAEEGESPLMRAAFQGHRDVVELLLDRGADPDYVTDKGWDAVQFARLGQHDELATLLEQAQRHRGTPPEA